MFQKWVLSFDETLNQKAEFKFMMMIMSPATKTVVRGVL